MEKQKKAARRALAQPIGQPKGDALAAKLREYYERGVAISELRADYSEKDLRELFNVSQDQLYKTLAFARYYEPVELDVLCSTRNSDGNPLRWAHVRELLVYRENKKARTRMQRQAATKGWTVDELHERIKSDRNNSDASPTVPGRRFKVDSVTELARRTAEVERLLASLLANSDRNDERSARRLDELLECVDETDRKTLRRVTQKLNLISRHTRVMRKTVEAAIHSSDV